MIARPSHLHSLLLFVVSALLLAAQTATEVEITSEPHHHFVFENPSVRVFNVEVAPHTDTLMHWHRHDYVYVALGVAHVSSEVKGKASVETKLQDGETHFLPATFAHIAHNLSDLPFRNVTIEFLQDAKLRQSFAKRPSKWDEERGLDILQGGTEEILFVKDGVRASEFELQPGGVLPEHQHAGPHLVVALTNYEIRSDVVGKSPVKIEMKTGESKWIPGGFTHTMTNTGQHPAKFVTLEFP